MKFILILCCLFIAVTAFADVKIVQRVKTGGVMGQPPSDGIMTMYIKPGKARVDNDKAGSYQILDLTAGKMFIVEPSKKQVMVLTTEQMKATSGMIAQLMGGGKSPAPPTVQKLGSSKTYNGFKCNEYKVAISTPIQSQGTYCVSPDINFDSDFRPLMDFSQELAQMFGGDALKDLGFPVHTDSTLSILGQSVQSSS